MVQGASKANYANYGSAVSDKKKPFWAGKLLCDVKHNPGLKTFQFHFTYYEDEVLYRVIGWSHPHLMDHLKQRPCSIFVDATFRCVPTHFYQLVVVMMYDPDLYLPVWYVLTSGKTSQIYEHIFLYICVASKKRLDPAHIV
ncbi:Hypothetical protein PHPALM_625 [Phytophthora palmivora]|uniref:MULE transposase domain-containing protein n=1 Tax=Phytophthora palmivora TaxID=4796 RepID=A0A2P4YUD5_9STRA|nr:Hypothetical protein PHPALM_625 [Phytophthora palmivora]